MLTEKLNNEDQIQFSGKYDVVELQKEGLNNVVIKKIKSGIASKIYFGFFLVVAALICYYAENNRATIIAITTLIFCSATYFLFLGYKTIFDKENKTVTFFKRFLFIRWKSIVPFDDILVWSLKEGEAGFLIKAKTGESFGFVHKLREEHTVCRLYKRTEAEELLSWIQATLVPSK